MPGVDDEFEQTRLTMLADQMGGVSQDQKTTRSSAHAFTKSCYP